MRRYVTAVLLLFCSLDVVAAVTGYTLDANGKPIPRARIRAFALEPSEVFNARLMSDAPEPTALATVQSGDDGAFRIDVRREPVVTLVVDAAGYAPEVFDAADASTGNVFVLRSAPEAKWRISAGGRAVAGAWVILNNWIIARTDERGEYPVADPPAWVMSAIVHHPDYAALAWRRTSEALLPAELKLEKGASVSGRVVDGNGRGVANAVIRDDRGPLAKSAEDGSFSIAHLASDVKLLRAVEGSRIGTAKPGATITLRPAGAITGTVRSSKDDVPVAGAKISLRVDGPAFVPQVTVVTDAKGRFAFETLAPDIVSLWMTHPFFVGGEAAITVTEGARIDRPLAATPISRVTGTVVDEQKKPVGAVRLSSWTAPPTFTAPDGSFSLRISAQNQAITLQATKATYAASTHGPLQLEPGEVRSGVRIVLPRGTAFEVRLVDREGIAIANEPVAISRRSDSGVRVSRMVVPCGATNESGPCRSDADGKLIFHLAEGVYDVRAGGETTVARELSSQNLGPATSPLNIELERGSLVEGRVVWSDGTAMTSPAHVFVMRLQGPGTPVTDGAFRMRNVPAGKAALFVRLQTPPGLEAEPVEVTAPATGVVLKVPRPGRIEGRVLDRSTRQPVRQFTAGTQSSSGRPRGSSMKPFSATDGRFVLEDVPPDTVDVVVSAPGYVRSTSSAVEVKEGEATSVEVSLDRAGTVTGRVMAGGRPVSGAAVFVDRDTRQTDANGDFTLDTIAPGSRELRVMKQGFVAKTLSVDIEPGKEKRVDVELLRGRELEGRVVDASGQPVPGASISHQPSRASSASMWPRIVADAEGVFRITGLADERVRITASKDGFAPGSTEVDPATATSVTVTLGRGATVSGRIIGVPAEEAGQFEVHLMGRSLNMPIRGVVDAAGAFTLAGVPDGEFTVNAQRMQQRGPGRSVQVKVAAGSAPFVEIDLASGFAVRGRVTRAGKPVSGMISLSPVGPRQRMRGGVGGDIAFGVYDIRVPEEGEYRVHVTPAGGDGTIDVDNVTVRADMTHDIEIRGVMLRGRVVDAVTGAPLPNVRVTLMSASRGTGRTSDSDGRFAFEFVPEGRYTVSASEEGYSMASRDIAVGGSMAPDVELALSQGYAVEIRTVDAVTGRPIDTFLSLAGNLRGPSVSSQRTEVGTHRAWLVSGTHALRVSANGYVQKTVTVTVPGPPQVVVELEVKRD